MTWASPSPEYYEPPDIDEDFTCYTDCRQCKRGRHDDCEMGCHNE